MTYIKTALVALALVLLPGCDLFSLDDDPNPNGAALEDVLANPTEAAIANVAVGVESSARTGIGTYLVDTGVLGREYWRVSPSDPRFTADLLGKETSVLDNNTFYITTPWAGRYGAIRNANTMLLAIDANATLSDAEKAGARGFAKTWIAYQYLLNLNLTFENGIKFIEPGDDVGGPLVGYDESLDRIAALLDEAAADLAGGGDAFFFPASLGEGVDNTPAGYRQINRGLAARVDAYREDWGGVTDALDESFLDADGDLDAGAYHRFSNNAGDVVNPLFFPRDAGGDGLLAHPDAVSDTLTGDTRPAELFVARTEARTFDGLTSAFDVAVPPSPTSPLPVIKNSELILLRAEARAQTTGDAEADINVIRNAAGLEDYDGDGGTDALIAEILTQRRYELYAEGHRWLDARRYGLLGTLPIDRPGDDVFDRFPIPESDDQGV